MQRRILSGRAFRYAVTIALHEARQDLTVLELVARLEAQGVGLGSYPRKAVSDALRWELEQGRVVRVHRGVYRNVRLARSSKSWMQSVIDDELRYRSLSQNTGKPMQ